MGINGINNLKGTNMTEEQQDQQQVPVGGQQSESATTPAPPVPAHEETERVTPQPDENTQPPVDEDEPGDDQLPEELQEHVTEGSVPPDQVDQVG